MTCGICGDPSKYKCPQCALPYCLVKCFKHEKHEHVAEPPAPATKNSITPAHHPIEASQAYAHWLHDPVLAHLLSYKSLHVHLLTIAKIISDPSVTNEHNLADRLDLANSKLCALRPGGLEQNLLVEEFVLRVLELSDNRHDEIIAK